MLDYFKGVLSGFQAIADNFNVVAITAIVFMALYFVAKGKNSINAKKIALIGILTAMLIVTKQFTRSFGPVGRIELVHIPIIISGVLFGPFIATTSAFLGDFVGGMLAGYTAFPVIFPFSYALLGLVAGFIPKKFFTGPAKYITLLVLFVLMNFVVEYITYIAYYVSVLNFDAGERTLTYFTTRPIRILWQLPLWLVVIPAATKRLKKVASGKFDISKMK